MREYYVDGLYRYAGIGNQRVILHIEGRWYLAGWEIPMKVVQGHGGSTTVSERSIGKLICEIPEDV